METLGHRIGFGLASRGAVRDVTGYAVTAERMGFESVWIHDSYFERDPVTYLASIAAEVQSIRIGAGAMNPYTRHPVVLAMTGAALDDLAPGRFSLALGSGLPLRLSQMHIEFDDTVAEVSRAIDTIRQIWTGEPLTLNAGVPPLQPMFAPPHRIPIYIAGYQGRFLDLCGEKADGYLARPAESVTAFKQMRTRILRSASKHGRPPHSIEFSGYVLALIGDSKRDALNRAKREPFVIYMMSVLSNTSLKRAGFPAELRDNIAVAWRAEDYHRAGQLIPDELLDTFLACGTREEVAAKVYEFHAAGMDVPFIQPILQDDDQVQAVLEAGRIFASQPELSALPANFVPAEEASANTPSGSASSPDLNTPLWHSARRRGQAWYEIVRPFSFTASIIPVSAGGAVAWFQNQFVIGLFLLTLLGAIGLQAGTNVINEIYDVRKGIDKITSPRASHALLKGAIREQEAFLLAFGSFFMVALIGVVLLAARGPVMLVFGITGLIAGYGYSGPPFQYKFHALGVPLVFVLMGPLEVTGSYFAITGTFSSYALASSIPIGLLVAAILHANEWRDMGEDARSGIATLSAFVGANQAHYLYVALVTGAYVVTGAATISHLLPVSTMLVLLSLPFFVSVIRASELGASGQVRALSMIDMKTARLHMYFGLLLVTGLFLARYIQ